MAATRKTAVTTEIETEKGTGTETGIEIETTVPDTTMKANPDAAAIRTARMIVVETGIIKRNQGKTTSLSGNNARPPRSELSGRRCARRRRRSRKSRSRLP
jgi:hypothetical protein